MITSKSLSKSWKYEKGKTDYIMIKGAEKEFGELYKIQIRKDKNGNDWHLDNITLHRDGEIKPISFNFDQWIKKVCRKFSHYKRFESISKTIFIGSNL